MQKLEYVQKSHSKGARIPSKNLSIREFFKIENAEINNKIARRARRVYARSNPKLLSWDLSRGARSQDVPIKGKWTGSGKFALAEFSKAYRLAKGLEKFEQIGGKQGRF